MRGNRSDHAVILNPQTNLKRLQLYGGQPYGLGALLSLLFIYHPRTKRRNRQQTLLWVSQRPDVVMGDSLGRTAFLIGCERQYTHRAYAKRVLRNKACDVKGVSE